MWRRRFHQGEDSRTSVLRGSGHGGPLATKKCQRSPDGDVAGLLCGPLGAQVSVQGRADSHACCLEGAG